MIKSLDGVDVTVSILSRDAFMQRTSTGGYVDLRCRTYRITYL